MKGRFTLDAEPFELGLEESVPFEMKLLLDFEDVDTFNREG